MVIMQFWGRKPIFGGCQAVSGLACILSGVINVEGFRLPLAIMGKFCSSAAFMIAYVYTAELYPTTMRSRAVGWSSMCGRMGGLLAPQVHQVLYLNLAPVTPTLHNRLHFLAPSGNLFQWWSWELLEFWHQFWWCFSFLKHPDKVFQKLWKKLLLLERNQVKIPKSRQQQFQLKIQTF